MRPLQCTLHDLGKLVDHQGLGLGGHEFRNAQQRLAALGIQAPQTQIWRTVFGDQPMEPRTREGLLVKLADHSAASFRAYDQGELQRDDMAIANTTVHRLWAPQRSLPLTKIASESKFHELMNWLASDPSDDDFLEKFGEQLRRHPEDQYAPQNTVSLDTHLRLVHKFYGFYDTHLVTEVRNNRLYALTPEGPVSGVKAVERALKLRLIRGQIHFGQEPARTRDLAIFQARARIGQAFANRDEILVFTIDQFIGVLPLRGTTDLRGAEDQHASELANLLGPWTAAGFEVTFDEARLPLRADTVDAPSIFRGASPFSFTGLSRALIEIRSGTAVGTLPEAFEPPICEVCQLEPGVHLWPRDSLLLGKGWCESCRSLLMTEDWPPPIERFCATCRPKIESELNGFPTPEHLGERCFNLRREGVSLQKLNQWTDDPGTLVAWLRVSLDLDTAERVLRSLYRDYAAATVQVRRRPAGAQPVELPDPDVRFSLVSEFVRDYHRLLALVGNDLSDTFEAGNVEPLLPKGINNVWCVRLQNWEALFKVLDVVEWWTISEQEGLFPELVRPTTKAERRSPIRVVVTASAAKYPFAAHWRQMEHVLEHGQDDVYVRVIGKGEMHLAWHNLGQILLDPDKMARPQRRAWHNLATIAQWSDDLARLRLYHQEGETKPTSADYTYAEGKRLLPDGIAFGTFVTALKLLEH